jgi:hypothetical protein
MTTLQIRKTGGPLTSHWVVTGSEGSQVATATSHLLGDDLRIETGAGRVTARILKRDKRKGTSTGLEVVDDVTRQQLVTGRVAWAEAPGSVFSGEEWEIRFASGATIVWRHVREGDRRLGFFLPDGTALIRLTHDPSFDVAGATSVFRILLRFWTAAAKAQNRYLAQADDVSVGRVIAPEQIPMLALLGVRLERSVVTRYPSPYSGSSGV